MNTPLSNSNKLKIRLLERGLTQKDVAAHLGISCQYLCDIFKGRKRPQPLIDRMVDELKLPASLFETKRKAA